MKDPLEDIELELRQWRPSEPGPRLQARLEQALDGPPPAAANVVRGPWTAGWRPWILAAAAALVALACILPAALARRPAAQAPRRAPGPEQALAHGPAPAPRGLRKVQSANYLLDAEDAGVIYASATDPLRKIRCQYLVASQWQDEEDHTTIQVLIPREQTMILPVNAR